MYNQELNTKHCVATPEGASLHLRPTSPHSAAESIPLPKHIRAVKSTQVAWRCWRCWLMWWMGLLNLARNILYKLIAISLQGTTPGSLWVFKKRTPRKKGFNGLAWFTAQASKNIYKGTKPTRGVYNSDDLGFSALCSKTLLGFKMFFFYCSVCPPTKTAAASGCFSWAAAGYASNKALKTWVHWEGSKAFATLASSER